MEYNYSRMVRIFRAVTVVVAMCAISQTIARLKNSKRFFGRYSVPLELFLHMSSEFNGEYGMIVYMMIFIDSLIPGLVRSELQIE
ncbi:unnamed protein product [Brugia timori]|uniref:Secreted protein n=1 Tax=Brugia timori TaxID=42155 RepID=A0A0R3QJM0_9BILA|nr:unnamed protein product [Brugia timori]